MNNNLKKFLEFAGDNSEFVEKLWIILQIQDQMNCFMATAEEFVVIVLVWAVVRKQKMWLDPLEVEQLLYKTFRSRA